MTLELFSLEGRIALVTGGNGGLGRAIAFGLRAAGAKVAVTGRNPKKNEMIGSELGDTSAVFALDVRDEDAVARMFTQIAERYGRLDVLVNNAGIYRGGLVLELSREDWDAVIETHLTGSFLCARQAAGVMVGRGEGGKIINIGSIYSIFGHPYSCDYGSAKSGILGLTRALAVELAPKNIQVNAILPGWYETDLNRGLPHTPLGEQIRRKTPSGRWGNPEDLIGAAIFLASAASDFVTGVCIPVDGGYTVTDRFLPE